MWPVFPCSSPKVFNLLTLKIQLFSEFICALVANVLCHNKNHSFGWILLLCVLSKNGISHLLDRNVSPTKQIPWVASLYGKRRESKLVAPNGCSGHISRVRATEEHSQAAPADRSRDEGGRHKWKGPQWGSTSPHASRAHCLEGRNIQMLAWSQELPCMEHLLCARLWPRVLRALPHLPLIMVLWGRFPQSSHFIDEGIELREVKWLVQGHIIFEPHSVRLQSPNS